MESLGDVSNLTTQTTDREIVRLQDINCVDLLQIAFHVQLPLEFKQEDWGEWEWRVRGESEISAICSLALIGDDRFAEF